MWQSDELNLHLKTADSIHTGSAVFAEWNMNQPDNIERLGNYRYRPGTLDPDYSSIMSVYDPVDSGNFYTGATDSDIAVDGGIDDNGDPVMFLSNRSKMNMLYSLEDCIKPNRPRSGINKMLYLGLVGSTDYSYNQYVDDVSRIIARRPRYYLSSKNDNFKYWTSFRYEYDALLDSNNITRGISKSSTQGIYYIDDAAPFVVYKEQIPTNKIVVKMQTNVGESSINELNEIRVGRETIPDPLYGDENKSTPKRWKIEVLKSNDWIPIMAFTDSSVRDDGTAIIKADGYLEITYGLNVPAEYKSIFIFAEEITTAALLPDEAPIGYTYLVKSTPTELGKMYIFTGNEATTYVGWDEFIPEYKWALADENITSNAHAVSDLTDPTYNEVNSIIQYNEFELIRGVRIVVDTMNKDNCTFDLIEVSPRLFVDVTDKTISFGVTKTLSDLGSTSLPVGNLLASVGSIEMFDDDYSFNENNVFDPETRTGSLVAKYIDSVVKFNFYEITKNVNNYDYYIPVKTMYSSGFPQVSDSNGQITISLRDAFYMLESEKTTPMLLTDVSLSYAITVLLDGIGFSNYVFRRVEGEGELIIPFFFVGPDQNIASVLQQLAMSSQSAMFFDEYNNLVVMSKNYLLPTEDERETDTVLLGQETIDEDGNVLLPNIINLSSRDKKVFNGGQINYTTRYINRSIGSISQAPYVNEYQTYIYKPSLLWEVSGQEKRQTINDIAAPSSGYSLAAVPLNSDLTNAFPEVNGNRIVNNVIDLGENVYWLGNFAGYLYANGEIIKYDAMEYSVQGVPGLVWISNNHEYQDYISKLSFNGKIFPTGNIRIWSEPEYYEDNGTTNLVNGVIKNNGRGQFGTIPVSHSSGIKDGSYWTDNANVRGCIQDTKKYLFSMNDILEYPTNRGQMPAGQVKYLSGTEVDATREATGSSRGGTIKNFLANKNDTENVSGYTNATLSGSVQASALVFNGPTNIPADLRPADMVSYVYKELEDRFAHFGTRMRIIGRVESGTTKTQTPIGGYSLLPSDYVTASDPSKAITVLGGSGGIGIGVNPSTNNGYFFEIVSLTSDTVAGYTSNSAVSSFTIAKAPEGIITTVDNNLVTVTTEKIHNFNVGDKVIISGLIDNNLQTNTLSRVNGEFEVTAVGDNRKSFQYQITAPTTTAPTLASSAGDGTYLIYTTNAYHDLHPGELVNITGTNNAAHNLSNQVVLSTSTPSGGPYTFTIKSTVTGGSTGGTATYIPLTTQCHTGGTATKNSGATLSISNVFFYKVVGGSNKSEIIKQKRYKNMVTVTTLNPHSYVNGERVIVTGLTGDLAGTKTVNIITSPTDKSFTVGGQEQTLRTSDREFCYEEVGADVAESELVTLGEAQSANPSAIPEVLWKGLAEINVDDGKFTGQTRFVTTDKPTVYDLSVEYVDIGEKRRRFFLYINGKQVAVVDDDDALDRFMNMALFVRGSSNCMFENVYALDHNYSQNTGVSLGAPVSKAFGDNDIDTSEALNKYALNGFIQQTYLSGIGSQEPPRYRMYFEEFGTIMREVAHFNIKYDRAFPALSAQLAPTLNRVRGYSVSGFYSDAYGADFLVFNCIDKNLNLDDTTGNYLRIHGIAFTQSTTYSLTVDEYFKKISNMSDPPLDNGRLLYSPTVNKSVYDTIKQSRMKYGLAEFSMDSPYIQTTSAAEEMLGWVIKKVMVPRKNIGLNTFATGNIQLGDIVTVSYERDGIDIISDSSKRFVVYNIEYKKDMSGITNTLFLSEV